MLSVLAQKNAPRANARDASGTPLTNQDIGLRLTVSSAAGWYVETQTTTTSDLGLFNVDLGAVNLILTHVVVLHHAVQ